MKRKRILCGILAVFMLATLMSGCGQKKAETVSKGSEVKLNGDEIYPVQCDDTITYWLGINPSTAIKYENLGDTPFAKELEKLTGIKVEYVHPQAGQEIEQFNIMLASDELPGMVQYDWARYYGGYDVALQENLIYSITDKLEEYAPALYKLVEENSELKKQITSKSGDFYVFPAIRGEVWQGIYQGMILRKDWLNKLGLEVPESVAELEEVLVKFKEHSGNEPLYFANNRFPSFMFGTSNGFYVDDNGKVQYGCVEENYKKAVAKMNDWYNKGLLHPDFATIDTNTFRSSVLNGELGVFEGAVGGTISSLLQAKPANDPEFDLMGIKQVTENGDAVPEFSVYEDTVIHPAGTTITKNCENLELAMRYLDFGYTEKGHMLNNFGIEGECYNLVDGEPVFTDLMKNNPEGYTFAEMSSFYLRAGYSGSFIQDPRYVRSTFIFPQQREAYDNFGTTNMGKHMLPNLTFDEKDVERAGEIKTVIQTYVDEMYIKFVTGREPLDKFDDYVKQIEGFGLQEIIDMYQKELDNYNNK